MRIARTVAELHDALDPVRQGRGRVGLVPTMGAFHDGHLALMAAGREASDTLVVSLFVNPAQFDAAADLARYPRDEERDAAAAQTAGVDVLFAPAAAELYPPGFDTWVEPGALADVLEGAARPGHFRGVATVCTKLFTLVRPNRAWFGQKDAQQVAVVRRVVADLALGVDIAAVPTVRDDDGLALSSRNVFLSPAERAVALTLPRALAAGAAAHRTGRDAVQGARSVLDAEPGLVVDYVALADFGEPTLVAAVRVGVTRLIDNVVVERAADAPPGALTSASAERTLRA